MACNYEAIRRNNKREYGAGIGRWGRDVLALRYDDRTHFIFELLQNAEDALARRSRWQGSRAVSFHLTDTELRISHFGHPFDEADVRGVCGIDESTKDLTAIGRFGIGFKSVYALTERPEVHSGTEAFAIENYVWPVATSPIEREADETVILLPLKPAVADSRAKIAAGLEQLGASTLLFLRQIEEVHWKVDGGPSGQYLRESSPLDAAVRRVKLIGQGHAASEVDAEWLVFSRPVTKESGGQAGNVEVAFCLVRDDEAEREVVERSKTAPLVVFFPTVIETHLGFLVQGPYRTTPSRDNVPRSDTWNQHLVRETGFLLVETLRWLRDHELLDTTALRCLPLDSTKFSEGSMFAPLFEAAKVALSAEPLLPRSGVGHVSAAAALLGRTVELRDLFDSAQLSSIYGKNYAWLSGDITPDRAPELRRYFMQELNVAEVTLETILPRLDRAFLEAQSDDWVLRFYEVLGGQPALRSRLDGVPVIRLEDGSHVHKHVDGQPRAFLPGSFAPGFPTVRAAVCATEPAREFLRSFGLTVPDPVDVVVRFVLPRYRPNPGDSISVTDADYEVDIRRILIAFAADSKAQREKLVAALRETKFVRVVDTGAPTAKWFSPPDNVYLATERLKALFSGVKGVYLVDNDLTCLRGEDVRALLEACGVAPCLHPVPVECDVSMEVLREIRRTTGLERGNSMPPSDVTLRGLDDVLGLLLQLEPEARRHRAALLWEALGDVETRLGSGAFVREYTFSYFRDTKTAYIHAAFVRTLKTMPWVPDERGELQRPEFVSFDALGWTANPFLQSKLVFKPQLNEALAREYGVEPGAMAFLKKHGIDEAQLRARFDMDRDPVSENGGSKASVGDAVKTLLGDTPQPTPPAPDPTSPELSASGSDGDGAGSGTGKGSGGARTKDAGARGDEQGDGPSKGPGQGGGKRTPGSVGGRPFISYVAARPDGEEPDPDGLDQPARMALEASAIDFILAREPDWRRTPPSNPGFDLFEADSEGHTTRWCEVKSMTGSLNDRPVGLSRTQFKHAQDHGEAYWLYVVEHTGTERARIARIQDPAGKARTFTFDRGWLRVADLDTQEEHRDD